MRSWAQSYGLSCAAPRLVSRRPLSVSGWLGNSAGSTITDKGTVTAGWIDIGGNLNVTTDAGNINCTGSFENAGNAMLNMFANLNASSVENYDTINIGNVVTINCPVSNYNGATLNVTSRSIVRGNLANDGSLSIIMGNSFIVVGDVTNNGTISFSDVSGVLDVNNFTQTTYATLNVVGSSDGSCSKVVCQAGSNLGGTLNATGQGQMIFTSRKTVYVVIQAECTGQWPFDNYSATNFGFFRFSPYYGTVGQVQLIVQTIPGGGKNNAQLTPNQDGTYLFSMNWDFWDYDAPGLTASDYTVTVDWGDSPDPNNPDIQSFTFEQLDVGLYRLDSISHVYATDPTYDYGINITIQVMDNVSGVTFTFTERPVQS